MDNRGVSAVLGYVITIGIITVLISGLLLAGGSFVESQQDRATRAEFEVLGNRVAADIAAVDRLALATGSTGEAELVTNLPPTAAANPYVVNISAIPGASDVYFVNISTHDNDISVEVRVKSATPIVDATVLGGDIRIVFNGTHIEVKDV